MIKVPRVLRVGLFSNHVVTYGVILSQVIRGSVTSPFTWLCLYLLVLHYSYIKRAALHCACPSCEAWGSFPNFKWGSLLS